MTDEVARALAVQEQAAVFLAAVATGADDDTLNALLKRAGLNRRGRDFALRLATFAVVLSAYDSRLLSDLLPPDSGDTGASGSSASCGINVPAGGQPPSRRRRER